MKFSLYPTKNRKKNNNIRKTIVPPEHFNPYISENGSTKYVSPSS